MDGFMGEMAIRHGPASGARNPALIKLALCGEQASEFNHQPRDNLQSCLCVMYSVSVHCLTGSAHKKCLLHWTQPPA
jgi:hypothetical protein